MEFEREGESSTGRRLGTTAPHMTLEADTRPGDDEYALLSQHVYGGEKLKKGDKVGSTDWKVHLCYAGQHQYFGVIYVNYKIQQVVLVHRGTDSLWALYEDIKGIFLNRLSDHKKEIFTLIDAAIDKASEIEGRLSFTGHSLGAFLAEFSVYYCHRSKAYPKVNAVTFESPGAQESLEALQSNHAQGKIDLNSLDVVSYLSYPNLVNTCNHHIGTLYSLEPRVGDTAWIPGWHLKQVHTMDNIVPLFADKNYIAPYITDWPMGNQRDYFFQHAKLIDGRYSLPEEQEEELKSGKRQFTLDYQGHYSLHPQYHQKNSLPLIHFSSAMQDWLKLFYAGLLRYQKRKGLDAEKTTEQFIAFLKEKHIDERIATHLLSGIIVPQQNGQMIFQSINETLSVQDIRRELTQLLDENNEHPITEELLAFVENHSSHVPGSIRAELVEEGGVIEGGHIEKAHVTASRTVMPEGMSAEDIQRLKAINTHFLENVAKTGVNITAVGIAKGAKLTGGTIGSLNVTGHETVVTSRAPQAFFSASSSSSSSSETKMSEEPSTSKTPDFL